MHANPHAPDVHAGVAWNGVGHRCPQVPQFARSDVVFTHVPAQYDVGALQTLPQCPPEQTVPGEHTVPHMPQCVFVVRAVSHPLTGLPSQFPHPIEHVPMPHVPAAQDGLEFGKLHTLPHAAHDVAVIWRFVSQPFAALPSQSPKPASQVCPHTPIAQVELACAPGTHA